jgi:hypothetical protein
VKCLDRCCPVWTALRAFLPYRELLCVGPEVLLISMSSFFICIDYYVIRFPLKFMSSLCFLSSSLLFSRPIIHYHQLTASSPHAPKTYCPDSSLSASVIFIHTVLNLTTAVGPLFGHSPLPGCGRNRLARRSNQRPFHPNNSSFIAVRERYG